MSEMSDEQMKKWVKIAVKNQNLSEYTFDITGKTSKEVGYVGNINFITITGKTKTGPKTLDVVIKSSKESQILREQTPIKLTFEKEIYIYDQVLTAFANLQKEKSAGDLLGFMPFCFGTLVEESSEVLILDNLNLQGFDVTDRHVPMTLDHIKLILEAYGKWHAFSFALRYHKKEIFDNLIKDNINMFSYFVLKTNMTGMLLDLYKDAVKNSFSGDDHTLKKLEMSMSNAEKILTELFDEEKEYQVIIHGDCWNNNFMFQEKNGKPISCKILDWQASGLASPVMDISHFIYGCCDTGKHQDVKELLKIYYESFSSCLQKLDCDSDRLFPFSKLLQHWKKFSRYGAFIQPFVVKFSICDASDAPDYAETAEQGKDFLENFDIKVTNQDEYYQRVKNNLLHYIHNLELD